MQYVFISGKTPLLSLAELNCILPENSIYGYDDYAVYAELQITLEDLEKLQRRLGGVIKIAQIKEQLKTANQNSEQALREKLSTLLEKEISAQSGKRRFGLSIYPLTTLDKKLLKNLLIFLKKNLKSAGNIRFVNKNFENLTSIQVQNEHLLDNKKGVELIIVKKTQQMSIAKTLTIQDSKAYAKRDYEKPHRDAKTGMLPPKLAQMMVNLANPFISLNKPQYIYDPFCGTGTILGEALLQGYNVIGSDRSQKALHQSKQNLDWLKREFKLSYNLEILLFQHSIDQPFPLMLGEKIPAAVVTESYLGPALKYTPKVHEKNQIAQTLLTLHLAFFKHIKDILKPETPIVIAFPVWEKTLYSEETNLKEKLLNLGFRIHNPLPIQQKLIYRRPDQIVGREIQVWMR